MPSKRVNASLSPENKAAILAALKDVRDGLPFLIGLTKRERKKSPAMGAARYAFVQEALLVAQQATQILPRAFSVEDFRRDVDLLDALFAIRVTVAELHEALSDTTLELGSEAYAAARVVYQHAKTDTSGAVSEDSVKKLGKAFRVGSRPHKAKSKPDDSKA